MALDNRHYHIKPVFLLVFLQMNLASEMQKLYTRTNLVREKFLPKNLGKVITVSWVYLIEGYSMFTNV